ncbi:hypothetical protein GCM10009733_103520 [Nonomuraea maheshkhaliensis]|uniref:SseB family protein n=1 Tax=Nonomuraea maheshkhaliensis TaxID=419590 RepID=A0ABN2HN96_9ACTN
MTSDPETPVARPQPTPLPIARDDVLISDDTAMEAIHRILNQHSDWNGTTFDAIETVILATGRRLVTAEPIATEVEYDGWDWPIARIETGPLTAMVRQAPDGGMCVDLFPADAAARQALRVLIDGHIVYGIPLETPVPPDNGASVIANRKAVRERANESPEAGT